MVAIPNALSEDFKPRIFYAGIFDYDKLIKTIYNWFSIQGYEFQEKFFKHKAPTPSGSEPEFMFESWIKTTEYVQFWIRCQAHLYEIKEVDVIINGQKKKMVKGKIHIWFWSDVVLDYNNKFNTPMAAKLQKFLHKHVWYKQISGGWEDECYYRMYKLHREVKEALGMSSSTNASDIRY